MIRSCLSSQSPALKSDFARFMQGGPDLTDVVDWVKNNIYYEEYFDKNEFDPDTIFSDDELEAWANKNGYYEYIDQFPQEKVNEWAKENGYKKIEKEEI
jgi:hypothetical protein